MTRGVLYRSFWIIIIAVVVAPLIGGLAFFVFRMVEAMVTSESQNLWDLFVVIALGTGTYVVGGPIASLAGALLAIIALWRTPNLAVILGVIVIANLVILLWQPLIGFGLGGLIINLVSSLFAGTICWLLFRHHLAGS
jgi:hypothetical protein